LGTHSGCPEDWASWLDVHVPHTSVVMTMMMMLMLMLMIMTVMMMMMMVMVMTVCRPGTQV
jgi:hypothetical protein